MFFCHQTCLFGSFTHLSLVSRWTSLLRPMSVIFTWDTICWNIGDFSRGCYLQMTLRTSDTYNWLRFVRWAKQHIFWLQISMADLLWVEVGYCRGNLKIDKFLSQGEKKFFEPGKSEALLRSRSASSSLWSGKRKLIKIEKLLIFTLLYILIIFPLAE